MKVCLPSVMHTGTHLMIEGYFDAPQLFRACSPNRTKKVPEGVHILYRYHTIGIKMEFWGDKLERYPIVVPMRHPESVWKSFSRRGQKSYDSYIDQWKTLIEQVHPLNPMYVHVDNELTRDKQIEAINNTLNLNQKVDWKQDYGKYVGNEEWERKPIPQEFIDFYYESNRCVSQGSDAERLLG